MKTLFRLIFIVSISFLQVAQAQVVNTEQKRRNKTEDGWDGTADLGFSLQQNTKSILIANSKVNVQFDKGPHTLLLLNDLKFMTIDKSALQNSGYQHVRYNFRFRKYLIPEAFVQAQFNQIWKVDFRFLTGLGPRFQLLKNDSMHLFLGSLIMYEFEQVDAGSEYHRDFRSSSYVSMGFGLNKHLTFENITYFQPLLKDFADFRISSETSLRVAFTKNLGFKSGMSINYDTRPVEGLPDLFYSFINSFSYRF